MSRWYDQHRTNRRLRRLEQQVDAVSNLVGDDALTNASLVRMTERRDRDAHDAREGTPTFRTPTEGDHPPGEHA